MNRKHIPLLAGGGAVLLLAIALFYLLFRAQARYDSGFTSLGNVQNQLQRLTNRSVFPSDANVQAMRKQLAIYQEYLDGLKNAMKKGQLTTETVTRDRFRQLAEEKLRMLVDDAHKKSVVLPPNFAFGFQRYAEGNIPTDEEMGRLVDQFRSVAVLCEILYDAGISELVAVDRTVFEKDAQAAPVDEGYNQRPTRGRMDVAAPVQNMDLVVDPLGLFSKEHYVLTYKAQDEATWKVLGRLAQDAPFVVVTKMDITNPAKPVMTAPALTAAPAAPEAQSAAAAAGVWTAPGTATAGTQTEAPILPRDLRVVAGREQPTVVLELDFYHFTETATDVAQGEENP